jgi:hypothetical protein
LAWLLAGALSAAPLLRGSESARLPPSHRRSLQLCLLLALCAVYGAVHVGSWDQRWLEWLADFHGERHAALAPLRPLFVLATALVPALVVAFGLRTRRVPILDLGLLLAAVSLVTLRFYVHVAPLWVVLVVSGLGALGSVLALRRWLASGPGGARAGFTGLPLFDDPRRRHAAEVMGAIATFSPAPATAAQPREPHTLDPGGGRYGGGGATSDF